MGTRSLTFVYEDYQPVICMYRQYDGYPEGHGTELANFLASIEAVTNGIAVGETRRTANGMGCLAAQLVAHLKTETGNIYLYPTDSKDCGQEYEYHIYTDRVTVYGWNRKHLFTGPWSEFAKWCIKPVAVKDYNTDEGKAELVEQLHEGVVTVTFNKKNGTERVMDCTLKTDLLPESNGTQYGHYGDRQFGDSCAVYDVANQGWRSFRWDSITGVK